MVTILPTRVNKYRTGSTFTGHRGSKLPPWVNIVGTMGLQYIPLVLTFSGQWGSNLPHCGQQITPLVNIFGPNGQHVTKQGSTSYPLGQDSGTNGGTSYHTVTNKFSACVNIFGRMGHQVTPRSQQVLHEST